MVRAFCIELYVQKGGRDNHVKTAFIVSPQNSYPVTIKCETIFFSSESTTTIAKKLGLIIYNTRVYIFTLVCIYKGRGTGNPECLRG